MKAYSVIAAALAVFAIGTLQTAPSRAAPAATAEKPLQLTGQQPAAQQAARPDWRKRTRATRRAPVEKSVPGTTQVTAAEPTVERDAPLPVVKVRTTRETDSESMAPVVQADELNEIDQAASSPSLVAAMIVNYLGGPAHIEDSGEMAPANTEEFPEEAKQAFAAEPAAPKASEIALEYILMTFGGALAAASAIRLFVV